MFCVSVSPTLYSLMTLSQSLCQRGRQYHELKVVTELFIVEWYVVTCHVVTLTKPLVLNGSSSYSVDVSNNDLRFLWTCLLPSGSACPDFNSSMDAVTTVSIVNNGIYFYYLNVTDVANNLTGLSYVKYVAGI